MADGYVYVDVSAAKVNDGIMTLDASGGGSTVSAWLGWTYGSGFTGNGWYYGDNLLGRGIVQWWNTHCSDYQKDDGTTYTQDAAGFADFMTNGGEKRPATLDAMMAEWNAAGKEAIGFISEHQELLGCLE